MKKIFYLFFLSLLTQNIFASQADVINKWKKINPDLTNKKQVTYYIKNANSDPEEIFNNIITVYKGELPWGEEEVSYTNNKAALDFVKKYAKEVILESKNPEQAALALNFLNFVVSNVYDLGDLSMKLQRLIPTEAIKEKPELQRAMDQKIENEINTKEEALTKLEKVESPTPKQKKDIEQLKDSYEKLTTANKALRTSRALSTSDPTWRKWFWNKLGVGLKIAGVTAIGTAIGTAGIIAAGEYGYLPGKTQNQYDKGKKAAIEIKDKFLHSEEYKEMQKRKALEKEIVAKNAALDDDYASRLKADQEWINENPVMGGFLIFARTFGLPGVAKPTHYKKPAFEPVKKEEKVKYFMEQYN